jgi:hypothetical protein
VPLSHTNLSLKRTYSFRLLPITSFAAIAPGDPAGVASAPRQDVLRVGQMTFNGLGGIDGHTIATTDNNSGQTVIITFDWVGTYNVNLDGTGTLTMTPQGINDASCSPAQLPGVCATLEQPETYAIAILPKRGRFYLTQTSNTGGAKIFQAGQGNFQ